MSDQTLPSSGGAYVRLPDGTLRLDEAPTADGYRLAARAAAAETPVETPVEGAVETPAAAPADPAPRSSVKRPGKDV